MSNPLSPLGCRKLSVSNASLAHPMERKEKPRHPKSLNLLLLELLKSSDFSIQMVGTDANWEMTEKDETKVSNMDDMLTIIRNDYENAYFVTGLFTSSIYADDCIFEDPTIKFQGKDLYSRNLKLLVPFFDSPAIELKEIEKGVNPKSIIASWKLRLYLKFPWRPLISVDGSTVYELDENLKIVRHVESWDISALEAIGQIFTPS